MGLVFRFFKFIWCLIWYGISSTTDWSSCFFLSFCIELMNYMEWQVIQWRICYWIKCGLWCIMRIANSDELLMNSWWIFLPIINQTTRQTWETTQTTVIIGTAITEFCWEDFHVSYIYVSMKLGISPSQVRCPFGFAFFAKETSIVIRIIEILLLIATRPHLEDRCEVYAQFLRARKFFDHHWVMIWSVHLCTIRVSIVVSIPACHAGDRGSIPRHGDFFSKITLHVGFIYFFFELQPHWRAIETKRSAFTLIMVDEKDDEEKPFEEGLLDPPLVASIVKGRKRNHIPLRFDNHTSIEISVDSTSTGEVKVVYFLKSLFFWPVKIPPTFLERFTWSLMKHLSLPRGARRF